MDKITKEYLDIYKKRGFVCIPMKTGTKQPSPMKRIGIKQTPSYDRFDSQNKNIGIMVGKLITVIDFDVKKDGMKELKRINPFQLPINTLTTKTARDGRHFYFVHEPELKHFIGVNGFGIDIINHPNLYITAPPSTYGAGNYEFIDRDAKIEKMPWWLYMYLYSAQIEREREKKKTEERKNKKLILNPLRPKIITDFGDDIVFPIDDYNLERILNKLPQNYCDDFGLWMKVGTACKNTDNWEVFDKWSKKSQNYNHEKNIQLWNSWKPCLSVNYIIGIVNKQKNNAAEKYIKSVRVYNDLNNEDITPHKKRKEYLEASMFDKGCNVIIVKSSQGTGKTTATVEFCYDKIAENKELRVIAIGSRQSLTEQHVTSFGRGEKKIILHHYLDTEKNVNHVKHLSIQLDSIVKIKTDDFKNTILFLDEFNSLTSYLISSSTLNDKRLLVYSKLVNMIKTSAYVLCVDADISDLSIELVKMYKNVPLEDKAPEKKEQDASEDSEKMEIEKSKIYFLQNTYDCNEKKKAFHYLDAMELVKKMKEHISKDKYFTACFDSKKTCDLVYNMAYDDTKKDKFLIYTRVEGKKIKDVNKDWKNKFVFYSPKIVYGCDFTSPKDQDVFVFIDQVSINCLQVVQQITRNRSIGKVRYWISNKTYPLKWNTLAEVRKHYKENAILYHSALTQMGCMMYNFGKWSVYDTDFFKLFCIEKFNEDTFFANFHFHFQERLKKKGFIIRRIGKIEKRLSGSSVKEAIKLVKELGEEKINKILESKVPSDLVSYKESIEKVCEILSIDLEDAIQYKEIIFSTDGLQRHWNLINGLKNDEYIKKKQEKKDTKDFKINIYTNTLSKILLTRRFEQMLGIKTFEIEKVINLKDEVELTDKRWKFYKNLFRSKKTESPKTREKLLELLVSCYRNLYGNAIIDSHNTRITVKKNGTTSRESVTTYDLNKDHIRESIKLYKNKDEHFLNFQEHICKMFDLTQHTGLTENQHKQLAEYMETQD